MKISTTVEKINTKKRYHVVAFTEESEEDHKMEKYVCAICKGELKDYTPEYCCSGLDCGCMGSPIEPPVCEDKECLDKLYG